MPRTRKGRPRSLSGAIKQNSFFDFDEFQTTLKRLGGNPNTWTVKNEWSVFSKTYLNTKYVRDKHARAAYNYFYKHKYAVTIN